MEFLRRRLGLIFRCLVSVLFLFWIFRKIDWGKLGADLHAMVLGWVIFSFLAFLPVLLTTAWRWRLLLRVQQIELSYGRAFELGMIGQFFNAMLLGTTGGDVVRIFYATRLHPQRKAAAAFSVVVDRVIGMVALLLFGVVLSYPQWPLFFSTRTTQAATGAFYFLAAGGVAFSVLTCLVPFLAPLAWVQRGLKSFPYQVKVQSLLQVYEKSSRAYCTNALALIGSFPSHLFTALMGYCLMRAMHLHPPVLTFCAILAIVNMLIAIPVSLSGLGVRESLFISFFGLLGISSEHAFAFSITFFGMTLLWSILGGFVYLFYRQETHAPPASQAVNQPVEA